MKSKNIFSLFSIAFTFFFLSETYSQNNTLKTIVVDAGHGGKDDGAVGDYYNTLGSKEKDITLAISLKLVEELKKQLPGVKVVPTRTTDIYQSPVEKADIANANNGDLFLCIHADSGPLKIGKKEMGTRTVTRYKITYEGTGKKRKKISTPYNVEEPIYQYIKYPFSRNGTSVWIFAAHKTSDKLQAIMKESGIKENEFQVESGMDSGFNKVDFNTPEGRTMAQIYAKRYKEKSDRLAKFVNEEVEKTNRHGLGVNQRQIGIWVLQATKMPAILVETGFINNDVDEKYLNSEKGQQEIAECITKAVIRYKIQLETMQSTSSNNNPANHQ
jgi:N-acetylmuramoyl-L-alanine amidase